MPWINVPTLGEASPALREAVTAVRGGMPPEYGAAHSERVPKAVQNDSIVLAHGLVPEALGGFFSAYNAFFSADLPLSRREQELIAVVVSKANECFY